MAARRIDAERARELLATGNYTYVDVRTPEEFEQGHVPAAKNIPIMLRGQGGIGLNLNDAFIDCVAARFSKDDHLIIGCQKGGRSTKAAALLEEQGYANVLDMRGGFIGETDPFGKVIYPGWAARGYPSTTECASEDRYPPPRKR